MNIRNFNKIKIKLDVRDSKLQCKCLHYKIINKQYLQTLNLFLEYYIMFKYFFWEVHYIFVKIWEDFKLSRLYVVCAILF